MGFEIMRNSKLPPPPPHALKYRKSAKNHTKVKQEQPHVFDSIEAKIATFQRQREDLLKPFDIGRKHPKIVEFPIIQPPTEQEPVFISNRIYLNAIDSGNDSESSEATFMSDSESPHRGFQSEEPMQMKRRIEQDLPFRSLRPNPKGIHGIIPSVTSANTTWMTEALLDLEDFDNTTFLSQLPASSKRGKKKLSSIREDDPLTLSKMTALSKQAEIDKQKKPEQPKPQEIEAPSINVSLSQIRDQWQFEDPEIAQSIYEVMKG